MYYTRHIVENVDPIDQPHPCFTLLISIHILKLNYYHILLLSILISTIHTHHKIDSFGYKGQISSLFPHPYLCTYSYCTNNRAFLSLHYQSSNRSTHHIIVSLSKIDQSLLCFTTYLSIHLLYYTNNWDLKYYSLYLPNSPHNGFKEHFRPWLSCFTTPISIHFLKLQ